MKKSIGIAAMALLVAGPAMVPAPASAQRSYDDRDYHGRDYRNRNRVKCGSGNGAVGTVAGGVGGGLLGNALGGGTLGTIVGAGGGALVGRHFDKKNTAAKNRRNNGC